jgi:hypothetical protein
MPKKKVENLSEGRKDDKQIVVKELSNEVNNKKDEKKDKHINVDTEKRAEELSNKILKVLYATYGAQNSHTNKHLYHHVMFEVALLSNRSIEEVMQKWPKFDIFTISEKIKKIVKEELESDSTIMHQLIMNNKIIVDSILAKAIVDDIK